MKKLVKLPQVNECYIISSMDDSMYAVVEYGETLAYIVETIDGTRQNLYFLDGFEMHFDSTPLDEVMDNVYGKTNFDMACLWFMENEVSFLFDRGNASIEVHVENPDKTIYCYMQISDEEIEYRAELWRDSRG